MPCISHIFCFLYCLLHFDSLCLDRIFSSCILTTNVLPFQWLSPLYPAPISMLPMPTMKKTETTQKIQMLAEDTAPPGTAHAPHRHAQTLTTRRGFRSF
ncbi:hypothetical protein B0T10DRAFT_498161 [Thelonectria olida]|uniref:Secreted protein n=1 Tax=Thelonectria olida TaxID=1576542 RepID=A0A9P9AJQ9_9HYPO|nr:hypothetical protein B0T10DRAFT_498161 [Thelonectria olida]